MREKVETFAVLDPQGQRHQVKRTTTYESGRLIGGGDVPTGFRTELADGTQLESMLGDDTFIDMSTGTKYTRA